MCVCVSVCVCVRVYVCIMKTWEYNIIIHNQQTIGGYPLAMHTIQ